MSALGDKLRALAPTFDAEGRTVLNPGYRHGLLDLAAEVDALEAERDEWKRRFDRMEADRDIWRDNWKAADEQIGMERAAVRQELGELRQRMEVLADDFNARLPDGTGNGRAYNAYTVARMIRAALDPAPPHQDAHT